ncbi:hypothetical protein RhiirA5_359101 [Rhizophagus irregularis]|uniref:Uncharacterized protein n=1 Tax=Rhizophagus irregularis TaxID=588596 RepID=A0A2I1DVJ5_9GLOM|nr:hypothetical protein RhiirA5_359101 [Rhizophagus irregularis]PKC58133.1 hypothetical protein RhiirA1_427986 [Rhizophagus irregularis]PKY13888.1 hypothetical protein RhiirB3_399520 [Rhizophagus irregularis]
MNPATKSFCFPSVMAINTSLTTSMTFLIAYRLGLMPSSTTSNRGPPVQGNSFAEPIIPILRFISVIHCFSRSSFHAIISKIFAWSFQGSSNH